MHLHPEHSERHFTASETVRDVVVGMSDGLTVPFALAAGISGAIASALRKALGVRRPWHFSAALRLPVQGQRTRFELSNAVLKIPFRFANRVSMGTSRV